MFSIFDPIIVSFGYLGAFLGLWLLVSPVVMAGLKGNLNKLSRVRPERDKDKKKRNPLIRHIESLLYVVYDTRSNYSVYTFFMLSGACFTVIMIILGRSHAALSVRLMAAVFAGLIPYLFLRVKLHNIRVDSSYEGLRAVTELDNQYKINHYNMMEAIDRTVKALQKSCPHFHKALFRLALDVKQYRNTEELDEAIQDFTFAINTQWAVLLANNIFLSIEYGFEVSESLQDILDDLKDIKTLLEDNKQMNHEGYLMIRLVAPLTYSLSVLAAIKFFGFSFHKFTTYQLNTSIGLRFFVFSLGSMIMNFIVYLTLKRPKYDY